MTQKISFADFFKIAPGLISLDKELDAEGCPVSYRKYLAADWFVNRTWKNTEINDAKSIISAKGFDIQLLCSIWYNNVYGHIVYEPPASRFIALTTPIPVAVTWSPLDLEVTLPDITLIQYELQNLLTNILDSENILLTGLKKFQNLPMAKWIWLAMADYDISVTSFELARPAYHLSLWHSFQVLEKILKATLIATGEKELSIKKYNHKIRDIISALEKKGISMSNQGNQLALQIEKIVGGPKVRYIDDSNDKTERLELSKNSIKVHHMLLEFFAMEAEKIGYILSDSGIESIFGINSRNTDSELRKKVHAEHKTRCSHSSYCIPPYAIPIRENITHPVITNSNGE